MSGDGVNISLSPPRRITDGPDYQYIKMPWLASQGFFKVLDTDTGLTHYCTTLEGRIKCGVSDSGFRYAAERKGDTKKLLKGRWHVEKIPKFLFIKRTGRTTDVRREYYWKW